MINSTAPAIWQGFPSIDRIDSSGSPIGVLALQGGFLEHCLMLRSLGAKAVEVRTPDDLTGIKGLILPGGESTAIATLVDLHRLRRPILDFARTGAPIWGTCAGMILLAKSLTEDWPVPLGLIDIEVSRNAFGRQSASFEQLVKLSFLDIPLFPAIFIRAPSIIGVGPDVEILASISDDRPVVARQRNVIVSAFHPELTVDRRFHRYFLEMVN